MNEQPADTLGIAAQLEGRHSAEDPSIRRVVRDPGALEIVISVQSRIPRPASELEQQGRNGQRVDRAPKGLPRALRIG